MYNINLAKKGQKGTKNNCFDEYFFQAKVLFNVNYGENNIEIGTKNPIF